MPEADWAQRETRGEALSPPPGFRLEQLAEPRPGVRIDAPQSCHLVSTYFDSADLRLARAGAMLRCGPGLRWTVQLPSSPASSEDAAHKYRFDGLPGVPPPDAADLVRGLIRTAPLKPVAHLRTRRRHAPLRDSAGAVLGSIVDDEVSVLHGDHVGTRYRELVVRARPTALDRVGEEVIEWLRREGAKPSDPAGLVRALGARAVGPPDVAADDPLPEDPTAGDVIRRALARSVARLLAHDPGVRLGDDAEDVHQARVAARRLRSDLRTFRRVLESNWSGSLRDELRWLGDQLGAVRDIEVLLDRLGEHTAALPESDREIGRRIRRELLTQWDTARLDLLDALRSPRYLELLDRLVDGARVPEFLEMADAPATDVLRPVVRAAWKQLARAVDALPENPSNEALHRIRIRAKRCRYAAEAVAPIVGKPARAFARRIAAVQDVLGRHQDAVVADQWLRELAEQAAGHDAFGAGEIATLERLDAARARAEWPQAWRDASRKPLRSWMR